MLDSYQEEAEIFGNFPSLFLGLVGAGRRPGNITTACSASWTATGQIVADGIDPARYAEYIGEAVES